MIENEIKMSIYFLVMLITHKYKHAHTHQPLKKGIFGFRGPENVNPSKSLFQKFGPQTIFFTTYGQE